MEEKNSIEQLTTTTIYTTTYGQPNIEFSQQQCNVPNLVTPHEATVAPPPISVQVQNPMVFDELYATEMTLHFLSQPI